MLNSANQYIGLIPSLANDFSRSPNLKRLMVLVVVEFQDEVGLEQSNVKQLL
jgi:hypothetical protein